MSKLPFPRLFSPFQIGKVALRNRIVCLPHATSLGEPSPLFPGDRLIAYYRERAKGGAGLITFSILPANMEPLQRAGFFPGDPGAYERLTAAVHAEGAAIFTQVTHGAGRQVPGPPGRRPPAPLLAPSPVACMNSRQDPHVLTKPEIHDLALATSGAARFARTAGFDGMELHSSHAGYLIQEFLSPASNQRDDEYGGSLENRMRFLREVLEAVRDAVGNSIIVGARLSVDEFIPGGLALEEGVEVACRVAEDRLVDYLSIDGGTYANYDTIFPDMSTPQGAFVPLANAVKQALPALPIIASHRINAPQQAEEILAAGSADLIGMARALVCDPELPAKALRGEGDRIRRCVACNEGCVRALMDELPIRCIQNPAAGRELTWGTGTLQRGKPRRVLVIGGGPAGLRTAVVAADRGHQVILCEKAAVLGGQVALQARVASRREIGEIIAHLELEAARLGVEVRLNTEVTPELVQELAPDRVILATGSRPLRREFCNMVPDEVALPGVDRTSVFTLDEALDGASIKGRVLVIDNSDGDYKAPAVAEFLADSGCTVRIVTPMTWVGLDTPKPSQRPLFARLWGKGIEVLPHRSVREIKESSVVLQNVYTYVVEEVDGLDAVVLVSGRRSNAELVEALAVTGRDVVAIGDCIAPRRIEDAIREGEAAARAI